MSDDDDEYEYEYESECSEIDDPGSSPSFEHSVLKKSGRVEEKFVILDSAAIQSEQLRDIDKCKDLLCISFHTAQRILMEYRWNFEEVSNQFVTHGLNHVLERSGVETAEAFSETPDSCAICMEVLNASNGAQNPTCGHTFCLSCWRNLISACISEGKSRRIPCGMHPCKAVVDADLILRALNDVHQEPEHKQRSQQDLKRYEKAMLDSFVEDNPRARWCPSQPCCGRAVKVNDSCSLRVDCECSSPCDEVFCFNCGDLTHTPCPCEWATNWKKKCFSESENEVFVLANCKPCPKCKRPIEKFQGCNHVTCLCGQSMCWLCGAATGMAHNSTSIVGHTCDKYRLNNDLSKSKSAKEQLDRYIHYFQRYETHMQSLRAAKTKEKQISTTFEALNAMYQKEQDQELADWLWIGFLQLYRMRRFIAWTYVFGYYAFYEANGDHIKEMEQRDPSKREGYFYQTIFEDLQTKLQNSIEDLSRHVEKRAEDMTPETKSTVLDLSNATHQQAINLWKYVDHEIMNEALGQFGYASPNVYFPIRRMVVGLGAKGVDEAEVFKDATPIRTKVEANDSASPRKNTKLIGQSQPDSESKRLSKLRNRMFS